jgi:dihydrolipoamide dehydrogenase
VKGTGHFKDANTIAVERRGRHLQSAIVAGSFPATVDGLDSPLCVDSTGLLAQDKVPARLVLFGGGIIGREFASIFRRFGSG